MTVLLLGGRRTVDIEQFPCLAKSSRELVLRQPAVRRPAGISDDLAAGHCGSGSRSVRSSVLVRRRTPLRTRRRWRGSMPRLPQVGMGGIHTRQGEMQRRIAPFFFPNQFPLAPLRRAGAPADSPDDARRQTTVAAGTPPPESNTSPWRRQNPKRCHAPGRRSSERHSCSDWPERNRHAARGESDSSPPVDSDAGVVPALDNGAAPPPGSLLPSPHGNPPSPPCRYPHAR